MTMRRFMLAVLLVPVFLLGISCEKEQPIPEEPTQELSVQEAVGEEPLHAGALLDEYANRSHDEDIDYESQEIESEDEDVEYESQEIESEDEDVGYESDEEPTEDEDVGYESDEVPGQEEGVGHEIDEEEGENEDPAYGPDMDEQA